VTAVVSAAPLVVERPRRFPARVEATYRRRRRRLEGRLHGRVLDLDRPEARAEVARASVERHVVPSHDTAVSVAQLVRFPDLLAALRALDRLVVPGGELVLVEPCAGPGLGQLVLDTLWAPSPWVSGFHVGRAITPALRCTSFVLHDIERFTMPTLVSPLRHGVEVHAARRPAAAEQEGTPLEATP